MVNTKYYNCNLHDQKFTTKWPKTTKRNRSGTKSNSKTLILSESPKIEINSRQEIRKLDETIRCLLKLFEETRSELLVGDVFFNYSKLY